MKKKLLALLLSLAMTAQMTVFAGADDEYIEDVPHFDVIEDGEIITVYDEYTEEIEEITEDGVVIGEVEDEAEADEGEAEADAEESPADEEPVPEEPVIDVIEEETPEEAPVPEDEILEGVIIEGSEIIVEVEGDTFLGEGETEAEESAEETQTSVLSVALTEEIQISVAGIDTADIAGKVLIANPPMMAFAMEEETESTNDLFRYDICIYDKETGDVWQPSEPVTVSITVPGLTLADNQRVEILHIHDDGTEDIITNVSVDGEVVTFETDSFSMFYGYTVDFEYNGIKYSMSGDSEIYLSELLNGLQLSYNIDDVVDVEFTNYDLLEITEEGGDWLLKSLASFGTEEYLTITFDDGEIIEILVTDPVIYNYAVSSNITNVPLLGTKTHTVANVDNGAQEALNQTYTVNSEQITVDNVKTAGVAEKTSGVHPAPDSVHMIIYAKEGMAIDFIGGTDWTYTGSKPTFTGNDIWFWAWESSVRANYVIVKDGSAGKQSKFTVTTTVDGKKYYCNVVLCVVKESSPTLLKGNLPSGYSIKNVPVTLYNYDGKAFNEYYNSNSDNYFAFSGTVKGVVSTTNAGNRGWTSSGLQANGGGSVALMGIVQDNLVNGLPVMSQGQKVDLFSTNTDNGKTVYSDVNFQFIYNDETGYYNYNSALNHAQYNNDTKTIELYLQSLAPSDTPHGASHGNAGFYPFEDINKAYTNTGYTALSVDEWKANLEADDFKLIPAQYSTDIVATGSTEPASTADMHYGLQVASDFYLPKGKQLNGQDMVYEFTGDDDLWVFIDGKLVLDIGGGHTYVSGSFNLTTGEVWVEKYTQLAANDGGSYSARVQGTDLKYTDSFLTELKDDQMHTIQIFYLERHGGVSNCRMRFNLPLVPSNAVNISKNVENYDNPEEALAVVPDVSYTFTLYTAADDDDTVDAANFVAVKDAAYTVIGSGAPAGIQYTDDSDGAFILKDGWTAMFEDIPRFTEVYVVETAPNDGYSYPQSTVSVNKEEPVNYSCGSPTATKIVQLNTSMNFDFVNYIDTEDLTIIKKLTGNDTPPETDSYNFTLMLDGKAYTWDSTIVTGDISAIKNGEFSLNADESVTIQNIPVNMSYSIVEYPPTVTDTRFEYKAPVYKHQEDGDGISNNESIALTENTKTVYVINEYNRLVADLIIEKEIKGEYDAHQSFLFKITRPDGFSMNIVINADDVADRNGSITIADLPLDTYTITEDTSWSPRYGEVSSKSVNAENEIASGDNSVTIELEVPQLIEGETDKYTENKVTVTNERTEIKWLDGNTQCTNIFDGQSDGKHYKDEE